MEPEAICRYQSRRNDVRLIRTENSLVVLKQYRQEESWQKELQIYSRLRGSGLPHGDVLRAEPLQICLRHLPGKNLVEVLDQQEGTGLVDREVWEKLVRWLVDFNTITGFVMNDVNLRNFLYDPETDTLYGVDFEECAEGFMSRTAALLAAYIRNYAPENTPVKREIAEYVLQEFSRSLNIPMQELRMETEKQETFLLERRKNKDFPSNSRLRQKLWEIAGVQRETAVPTIV